MAAALVLHLGEDSSHRIEVMRSAGYRVEHCNCEVAAVGWFRAGRRADIVCITEALEAPAEGLLAVTRYFSSAPVVLFRSANHHYMQQSWDLEVPLLTPPECWLSDFAVLLTSSRANRKASEQLRTESEQLRKESKTQREQSARLRQESLRLQSEGRRSVREIVALWRKGQSGE